MKKINFETGTQISPAKVTIGEVEHEVSPAQWQGNTPLSPYTLNLMQKNIEESSVYMGSTAPTSNEKIWIKNGKNLLNLINGIYSHKGVTAVVSDGTITLNGTATGGNSFIVIELENSVPIQKQTRYVLSANNTEMIGDTENYASIRFTSISGTDSSNQAKLNVADSNKTITTNGNTEYIKFEIRTAEGLEYSNFVLKPQLERNSTATSYERYLKPEMYYKDSNEIWKNLDNAENGSAYLLKSGGTINGKLEVTEEIAGNLIGDVTGNVAGDCSRK